MVGDVAVLGRTDAGSNAPILNSIGQNANNLSKNFLFYLK
jgi:hypothetical protein